MNHGQEHPSATIRALTDERFLAAYRALVVIGVAVASFFLVRLVSTIDDTARQMQDFKAAIQAQVSDFKIEVARSTSTNNTMIQAIQSRMDAHSRRMDIQDNDIRDINKRLYEGRAK